MGWARSCSALVASTLPPPCTGSPISAIPRARSLWRASSNVLFWALRSVLDHIWLADERYNGIMDGSIASTQLRILEFGIKGRTEGAISMARITRVAELVAQSLLCLGKLRRFNALGSDLCRLSCFRHRGLRFFAVFFAICRMRLLLSLLI